MRKSFWITALAFAGLAACMPAPPPPAPVDVMGEVVVPEPEPANIVCENGVCAPVTN